MVFAVFYLSAVAESRFSAFFQFQPWRKRCFCCFLFIRRGGKPIFAVFCPSYPYERLFLPFFIDCTPTKRGFQRFLLVVGVRKTVFRRFLHFVGRRRALSRVFCVSSTDDEHFSAFFAFRRPTTSVFSRFLRFVSRR